MLHLASWNLPDSELCLESKTEPSVAKEGGGHRTEKTYTGRGGHRTSLIDEGNKVGTPHNIERKSLAVGGWACGGWSKLDHKATQ